jgi:CrcB protein
MTAGATTWLLVAVGGALGALARHAFGAAMLQRLGDGMPWGTLAVNLAGSLAAGLVVGWSAGRAELAPLRAFVLVGLLGAFTTYSSLMLELLALMRGGRHAAAALYLGVTLVAGLVLVATGARLGGALRG